MDKRIFILILILALFCMVASAEGIGADTVSSTGIHEGIIRFHVIANSDADEDQELKLAVRNNVMAKLENGIAQEIFKEKDKTDVGTGTNREAVITRRYINAHMNDIREWAQESIRAEGFEYDVSVDLGVRFIPAKEYDGVLFPAGNYEALNVVIGEGKGHNWWCVIFPPLCLVDCKDSAYKDYFDVDNQGRLVLKSKVKELLSQKQRIKESN